LKRPRIALIGDYNSAVIAHQGIDRSMELAQQATPGLTWEWIHTNTIGADAPGRLAEFSGVWVVPASPYADEKAALASITHARTQGIAFLGTCGGFQHALIEFAREALGLAQAGHGETDPGAAIQLVTPLTCSLVERTGRVHLLSGSRLRDIYGAESGEEGYHCNYGLNPAYENLVSRLRVSARDDEGEVRAIELQDHPFFIATLFQPERRALTGGLHPLVAAFIEAAR
jgi:CTP synthase (UTP-ammonia lyase)